MEQEHAETIVVYAPRMHSALVPSGAPAAVLRFDPLAPDPEEQGSSERGTFRPVSLPLDDKQAKAWIREMLAWGLQFDTPGQLSALAAADALHKQRDIGGMGASELEDLVNFSQATPVSRTTSAKPVGDPLAAARLQAQLQLLLAWNLEQRSLEVSSLNKGIADNYARFGQVLGLDSEEEAAEAGLGKPMLAEDNASLLPRLDVVAAMLAFLPAGSCLYSEDQGLLEAWAEQGLEFVALEEEGHSLAEPLGTGAAVCKVPGWRLAGLRGAVPEKPWLEREFWAACRPGVTQEDIS